MRTFKWTSAALLTAALFVATAAISLAAPTVPHALTKAHSEAWHDFYLDQNNAARVMLNIVETPQAKWRGGLAEQQAQNSVAAAAHKALRGAVHGEEWDSVHFDRTVGKSAKPTVIDYQNPLTWQGCHAQADHKVQPSKLVMAVTK